MKKIKLIIEFIKLKYKRYNKEMRMVDYAINNIITFEQYEKYFNKKVKRRFKRLQWKKNL